MENVYLMFTIFLFSIVLIDYFNNSVLLKILINIFSFFKDSRSWNKCKKVYINLPNGEEILKDIDQLEKIINLELKEKILKKLNSGSILLIQNNSDTASMLLRIGSLGRFSHCSMVLQPDFLDNNGNNGSQEILLWQAAGEKICSKNLGPDIHSFTKFLSNYIVRYPNCRYVFRNLKTPLNRDQSFKLSDFIVGTIKRKELSFPTNFELLWLYSTEKYLRFLIPLLNINNKQFLTFCSKIVTETYQHIGLLNPNLNIFATNPNDFAADRCGPSSDIFGEEFEVVFKM